MLRSIYRFGVALLLVLLVSIVAFADVAVAPLTQPAAYTVLLDHLVNVVGTILGIVLTAVAVKVFQKLGLNLTQDQESAYQSAIMNGIGLAEEKAHQALAGGKKVASDDKLSMAMKFALIQIEQTGLEAKTEDWIRDRIHAALGLNKIPAPVPVPAPVTPPGKPDGTVPPLAKPGGDVANM